MAETNKTHVPADPTAPAVPGGPVHSPLQPSPTPSSTPSNPDNRPVIHPGGRQPLVLDPEIPATKNPEPEPGIVYTPAPVPVKNDI